ncbi:MAG: hypothetical protein B7Y12_08850 [Rhizobiales bacterium 24-66-13]|jgi:endonuclease YncB( thermonuclease family)|uniref:hypothetical protein n=1 Tax=Roseixanthobacter finlandensis TaxID=3119922 RepID=UPI000BDC71C0|nr:MAG: hypothetical protein B7Y61_20570 [Rhizobiales bacterium 35-66-30]OYZ79233.1 MAG: hypothetical protein B7Y12_08850 [Rhizobiales bacterium 24-66-13]OZB10054.1 MAG: hypothetical protein B7X67_06585 [Rhizobiales bacterium 39-66-18]HQS10493.1 hypothetical protein [Xanthobacteraceae bacterium]HQS49568.1 hypothetical protein [Xanthobacteraceae bacterium]
MRIALAACCALVLAAVPIGTGVAQANSSQAGTGKSSSGKSAKTKSAKASASKTQLPPDTRVWSLVRGDDTYVLRFGQPRAADPAFAATCQPSAQLLQIALEVNSTKIRSGDGVALSLSSGKRHLELAASAFLGSSDGLLVVEAAVSLEPRVFDIFRDGDTLTIRLAGQTQTLPLAGARSRLQDFERACLTSR